MPIAFNHAPPGVQDSSRRQIQNPVTGEDVYFEKYGHETNGRYTVAIATCKPGGGPPLHYHRVQTERFTAVEGDATIQLGTEPARRLKLGETVEVPPGTLHRFSAGEEQARLRVEVLPANEDFEKSLYILFGLAKDGLVGVDGLPTSLVHTAVVGSMGGMFFPGVSGMMLNSMTAALYFYARISGVQEKLVKQYWG